MKNEFYDIAFFPFDFFYSFSLAFSYGLLPFSRAFASPQPFGWLSGNPFHYTRLLFTSAQSFSLFLSMLFSNVLVLLPVAPVQGLRLWS